MKKQEFLAMSLPHELQILVEKDYNDNVVEVIELLHGISMFGKKFYIGCAHGGIATITKPCNCKPILHPLSDLTKEIEHNGEKFVPIFEIERIFHVSIDYRQFTNRIGYPVSEDKHIIKYEEDGMVDLDIMVYFNIIRKLIEWHFDIAGLIDKGEAINVNTLPENPYK